MGKQMEGDDRRRHQRAGEAREEGKSAGDPGVALANPMRSGSVR